MERETRVNANSSARQRDHGMNGKNPSIDMSPGVLAPSQIERLYEKGAIRSLEFDPPKLDDGSAFDLPLGTTAWKLTEGQRPATRELTQIQTSSSDEKTVPIDSEGYFHFKKKQIYLVQLDSYLRLPPNINGRATGKSSIGRLDVITRLLTDDGSEYDVVDENYKGRLYLLVLPQTFDVMVRPGESLNQLRLFSGSPYASVIPRPLIGHFGSPFWYIQRQDRRREYEDWDAIVARSTKSLTADPSLFDLTVDLADPEFDYIFEAKSNVDEPIYIGKKNAYDPKHYFEKVEIDLDPGADSVLLERDRFYIMKSKERLHIPCDVAVEVIAISERIGDIRIHYAGFAHPNFGRHEHPQKLGTPLIFEVRATDMKTKLYDGSLLARIQLYRMSTAVKTEPSAYEEQELKLSKVFYDWAEE